MARAGVPVICPCGSAAGYDACCGRWHRGAPAPTPEALMRSRYSAYVLGLAEYLLATWHPQTRPAALQFDPGVRWLGLDVRAAEGDTVEFVARSKRNGRATRLHEISRFVRSAGAASAASADRADRALGADSADGPDGGRWLYLDGSQPKRSA